VRHGVGVKLGRRHRLAVDNEPASRRCTTSTCSSEPCHSGDQWRGPDDQCETDLSILGTLVHGKTSAETNGAGQLQHAEARLPVKLSINTPKGVQPARIQARVGMPHRVFSSVKILGWILRDGDLHGVRWNTLGHLRQEPPPF